MARCWDQYWEALKGQGNPTVLALIAFDDHEAARAVDACADHRAVNTFGLRQPDRGEHRGVMSMHQVNWSPTWVSGWIRPGHDTTMGSLRQLEQP